MFLMRAKGTAGALSCSAASSYSRNKRGSPSLGGKVTRNCLRDSKTLADPVVELLEDVAELAGAESSKLLRSAAICKATRMWQATLVNVSSMQRRSVNSGLRKASIASSKLGCDVGKSLCWLDGAVCSPCLDTDL
jgi:hypothetical protein